MAKSNAERQAAYRARHLQDECGKGERLNLVIDLQAKRALERLASCYCLTQRKMLERILIEAERVALDQAAIAGNKETSYYEGNLKLSFDNVTL